jgi:hypothetical protein
MATFSPTGCLIRPARYLLRAICLTRTLHATPVFFGISGERGLGSFLAVWVGTPPPRLALASQVWGCSDRASRCPGPRGSACPKGRDFACLLPEMPAQLLSCHSSERTAAVGVGLLPEAVWLTSLMRVPALAFAIRQRAGALPAYLPQCAGQRPRRPAEHLCHNDRRCSCGAGTFRITQPARCLGPGVQGLRREC